MPHRGVTAVPAPARTLLGLHQRFVWLRLCQIVADQRGAVPQRPLRILPRKTFFGERWTANDLIMKFHYAPSAAFSRRPRFPAAGAAFFSTGSSSVVRCRFGAAFFSESCSLSIAGCEKIARS